MSFLLVPLIVTPYVVIIHEWLVIYSSTLTNQLQLAMEAICDSEEHQDGRFCAVVCVNVSGLLLVFSISGRTKRVRFINKS